MMLRRALLVALVFAAPAAFASPRVDLNPDNDRKDVLSAGCENWRVPDGPSVVRKFRDVTVTLRAVGSPAASISGVMNKAGYDLKKNTKV